MSSLVPPRSFRRGAPPFGVFGFALSLALPAPSLAQSEACIACHETETPGVLADWRLSRHAEMGVGCTTCHGEGEHDAYDDNQPIGSGTLEFGLPQDAGRAIGLRAVMKSDRMISLDAFLEDNPEIRTTVQAGFGLMTEEEAERRKEILFPSQRK